ncbi:hypothetical protein H2203_005455 [Taxawa tesnikishii (nom. ined.)]|nr:hypothetical protein H2203_005455 [Dothideales sp. JES 119]
MAYQSAIAITQALIASAPELCGNVHWTTILGVALPTLCLCVLTVKAFMDQELASPDATILTCSKTSGEHPAFRRSPMAHGSQSSAAEVFDIFELTEAIILHLPVRDALLCQRVNSTWRTVVKESLPVRRALFLAPATCGPVMFFDWRMDSMMVYDRRKNEEWTDGIDHPHNERDHEWKRPQNRSSTGSTNPNKIITPRWGKFETDPWGVTVLVNPLIAKAFGKPGKDQWWSLGIFNPLVPSKGPLAYPEASWRKMFFQQPPAQRVRLREGVHNSLESGGNSLQSLLRTYAASPTGVTMDNLVEQAAKDYADGTCDHRRNYVVLGHHAWAPGALVQMLSLTEVLDRVGKIRIAPPTPL